PGHGHAEDVMMNHGGNSKFGSWRSNNHHNMSTTANGTPLESRGNKSSTNSTNQTVTVRYRSSAGAEMLHRDDHQAVKSRRQNGGRSSSGNWSAATSDLLQSSSTSSSPLHPT